MIKIILAILLLISIIYGQEIVIDLGEEEWAIDVTMYDKAQLVKTIEKLAKRVEKDYKTMEELKGKVIVITNLVTSYYTNTLTFNSNNSTLNDQLKKLETQIIKLDQLATWRSVALTVDGYLPQEAFSVNGYFTQKLPFLYKVSIIVGGGVYIDRSNLYFGPKGTIGLSYHF